MPYELPQERQWGTGDRAIVSLLVLATCALCLWVLIPLDNDAFFLLSHGRYVLEHGLPTTEPFTFHEGLRFVMQQWLSAVIFFYIYSLAGFTGLYILAYVIYTLYCYFTYKISMLISNDNMPISVTLTFVMCIGMGYFIILRPWIFSGFIILLEIYCLELYIYRKKLLYLISIPILSVLLINMHAAIWPVFFIFLVPYIVDGLHIRVGILKLHGYGSFPISAAGFAAVLAALVNPYSTDAMTYLYYSYNNPYIKEFIVEMRRPSFDNAREYIVFALYLFVVLAYCLYQKGTSRFRYVFLTLTTAYMGLSALRSVQYFFLTFPYLGHYYRNFDIIGATESKSNNKKTNLHVYSRLFLLLTLYCILIFGLPRHTEKTFFETFIPEGPANYILDHLDVSNIRLFNDFDLGDFLIFKGIRPFIDSRADVFLKANNGKEDILNEYFEFLMGRTYYLDFIAKYKFTHFLAVRGSIMDTCLSRDRNMFPLYEDAKYRVFRRTSGDGVQDPRSTANP